MSCRRANFIISRPTFLSLDFQGFIGLLWNIRLSSLLARSAAMGSSLFLNAGFPNLSGATTAKSPKAPYPISNSSCGDFFAYLGGITPDLC